MRAIRMFNADTIGASVKNPAHNGCFVGKGLHGVLSSVSLRA
jgi:hypothetical protein